MEVRASCGWQAVVKRVMDIIGAFVGLGVTAAVSPLIALAIKLDSPGPVLFVQERVGRNGRRFCIRKFRTMCQEAEAQQASLAPYNEMTGPAFKMTRDPRVTRAGRFLRHHNLDELPQFWNVLKGDMSLVGPRPATPEEVEAYQPWHRRRTSVRPGITGLAQVIGRGMIRDFDEVARLDLRYIDEWSLRLDVAILLGTPRALLPGRHAR